jgi:hypothetical protein
MASQSSFKVGTSGGRTKAGVEQVNSTDSLLSRFASGDYLSNPWESALTSAYEATEAVGDGTGRFTPAYHDALTKATALTDKDYTADLNKLAQDEITKEQTNYNNQLAAAGVRELQFQKDVQDDWAERRTTASTESAISGQSMQTSALDALNAAINSSSGYELENIAAELAKASSLVSAATAGTAMEQNWKSMLASIYAQLDAQKTGG